MRVRPRTVVLGVAPVFVVALAAFYPFWLTLAGRLLVHSDPPCHADLAVVLAGDWTGQRVLRAAELVKDGYVRKVLLDGPKVPYPLTESDVAMQVALDKGYPKSMFIRYAIPARSTKQEADDVADELQRLGVRRFVLVTSNYHTARARRIFQRRVPDIPFCTVAASDDDFTASGWWKTREGRGVWFVEWCKTVAEWLGV